MQNQNNSFFDQETYLAEIKLPTQWKLQILKWTKKEIEGQFKNKNNEYQLLLEDEKYSIRMNIIELKLPINKCTLLIPTPPNNELGDIQNIGILPYKAKTKLIIVKKIEICKYIFQPLISEIESEKNFWNIKFMINFNCLIQGFEKYQIQILNNHNK